MGHFTLTKKQQAVFKFIQRYISQHRRAPFISEIQTACQITSYKSVIDRLNSLEHKGFIKRIPHRHRAIRIRRKFLEAHSGIAASDAGYPTQTLAVALEDQANPMAVLPDSGASPS